MRTNQKLFQELLERLNITSKYNEEFNDYRFIVYFVNGEVKVSNIYMVSKNGTIINKKTKDIIKPSVSKNGYCVCNIKFREDEDYYTIYVHRAVVFSWTQLSDNIIDKISNSREFNINHIDENKTNNDLSNLEIVPLRDNIMHSIDSYKGEKNKLKFDKLILVNELDKTTKEFTRFKDIAEYLNCSLYAVYQLSRGELKRIKHHTLIIYNEDKPLNRIF